MYSPQTVDVSDYTLWTIKRAPFYFGNNLAKCWPNFTIFGRNVAEKICNIFMLCCSPLLFSVVTLPQENEVPFNYARTCESVLLTAAIMLMIKTYPPNSPDLNPVDYKVWGLLQEHVYKSPVKDMSELKQRLVEAWSAMPQRTIDEAIDVWRRRFRCCVSLPKADTSNTSYDTYIGNVNLNGFVQPVRFYH